MKGTEIIEKLKHILYENFSLKIRDQDLNEHVFSNNTNMGAIHLIYLLYLIEDEFKIEIDNIHLLNGSFCSINKIKDIIFDTLSLKER